MQGRVQILVDSCVSLGEQESDGHDSRRRLQWAVERAPRDGQGCGIRGQIELRQVHSAAGSLSPLQIRCHEDRLNQDVSICASPPNICVSVSMLLSCRARLQETATL